MRVQRVHRVAALGLPIAQQVRPDLVSQMFAAQVRLAIQRFDAHFAHQRADVLASDHYAFTLEQAHQHARADKRMPPGATRQCDA